MQTSSRTEIHKRRLGRKYIFVSNAMLQLTHLSCLERSIHEVLRMAQASKGPLSAAMMLVQVLVPKNPAKNAQGLRKQKLAPDRGGDTKCQMVVKDDDGRSTATDAYGKVQCEIGKTTD